MLGNIPQLLGLNLISAVASTAKDAISGAFAHRAQRTELERELELEKIRAEKDAQAELARTRLAIADADTQSVANQKHSLADETLRLLLVCLLAYVILEPEQAKAVLRALEELPLWVKTIYVLACIDILGVRGIFTTIGDWLSKNRKS